MDPKNGMLRDKLNIYSNLKSDVNKRVPKKFDTLFMILIMILLHFKNSFGCTAYLSYKSLHSLSRRLRSRHGGYHGDAIRTRPNHFLHALHGNPANPNDRQMDASFAHFSKNRRALRALASSFERVG